jgi:regulation of enolase protein 1 (concanavalin A-like superfamily)
MLPSIFKAGRLTLLASCLIPAAAVAGPPKTPRPFSDIFVRDTSINPGWIVAEPNAGASYGLVKKGLLLDASAQNGGSDLWPETNYNASLLLQPLSSSLNWTATTKIAFQVTNNYMGAGLVLTTQTSGFNSSSVFHRFEYGDNPQPGIEAFTNGTPDSSYIAFSGKLVYLQLQKAGTTYTYSYSTDGKTWTKVETTTDAAAYTYIGVISIRQPYDGVLTVDSKPVFASFKIKVAKS